MCNLAVTLYIPNILGYIRILLAFYALYQSGQQPTQAVITFIVSALLDLLDGILARWLNQTSSFGILLDIAADNILRTCGWMAVAVMPTTSPLFKITTTFIICVEWITFLSTQLLANNNAHWKEQQQSEKEPWIVRALFANNFRNPMGFLSIYGLFSSYLWAFGAHQPELYLAIPFFTFFQYTAYVGRALSLLVELYMVKKYLLVVIEKDSKKMD